MRWNALKTLLPFEILLSPMNLSSLGKLIGSIILCEAAGILGSLATAPQIGTWYQALVKPAFTPPSWVFGPAWTTLYFLMGISLFLVLEESAKGKDVRVPLVIFAVQLILNSLWSFLFFGLESPFLGLIGIAALWIAIVATIGTFYRVRPAAAYLLVPYLAWVTFASLLNYSILILNPPI